MALRRSFPTRDVWRRPPVRPVDLLVGAMVVAGLYAAVRIGVAMNVPFEPGRSTGRISTDASNLPAYAARSLARMFIALAISVAFTFVYATAAARSRRGEKVLVPLLDVLQAVPVLGFLSATVTFFIGLFRGSLLGLEAASVFAIFTSQVWNMTFSMYHSLSSQPRELDEAARLMRLTPWQRFWRLDVPHSMIPLVWNGMMSFGGAWFFLAASEAITVGHHQYSLPGIGSYVAAASMDGDLAAVLLAVVVMVVMVIGVNALFWRPMVAWAERFRMEETEAEDKPRSVVFDVLRRSRVPGLLARPFRPLGAALDRASERLRPAERLGYPSVRRRRAGDAAFAVGVLALFAWTTWAAGAYVARTVGLGEFRHAFWLGFLTFLRVVVVLAFSTLVWVPVGVKIGLSPRLTRIAQPVVQVLASFPANFLFPFATAAFVAIGLGLDVGGIVLMALGAQWYLLFNAIAGAMAIPSDLRDAMDDLGVHGWHRWRRFIIPAIFPAFVTGGITAAGGAWNASIVAEVVSYGGRTLVASGLGAYITEATVEGDLPRVLIGVVVMSIFVVGLNRLVWRRLYRLAETRYTL